LTGTNITTQSIKAFARTARKQMRTEGGGYRRDYLRALVQRVEVDAQELRIMGSKANCTAPLSPLQAQKRRVLACPVLYRSGATFRAKLRTRILLKLHCHFGMIWGLTANDALRSSKPRPRVDFVEQVSGRCEVGLDSARQRNHAGIAIELGDRRAAAKESY
jgi:hypothetical protein